MYEIHVYQLVDENKNTVSTGLDEHRFHFLRRVQESLEVGGVGGGRGREFLFSYTVVLYVRRV